MVSRFDPEIDTKQNQIVKSNVVSFIKLYDTIHSGGEVIHAIHSILTLN